MAYSFPIAGNVKEKSNMHSLPPLILNQPVPHAEVPDSGPTVFMLSLKHMIRTFIPRLLSSHKSPQSGSQH